MLAVPLGDRGPLDVPGPYLDCEAGDKVVKQVLLNMHLDRGNGMLTAQEAAGGLCLDEVRGHAGLRGGGVVGCVPCQ